VPSTPSAAPRAQAPSFGSGTKIIGTDIQPGTYRSRNTGTGCYWARLSGLGGTVGEIIANDNATGPAVVTIAPTDRGFQSSRCADWSQDLSPVTSSQTAPFGDGTYIVGTDIAPGTWRSAGSEGCYWARLSGFGGGIEGIIANDNASGSAVVTISPTDKGFTSRRCGMWTRVN
jgi:hypothetical protein